MKGVKSVMTLALVVEPQVVAQVQTSKGESSQLKNFAEFAAIAHLCQVGEVTVAKAAGLLLRETDPSESYLAVRFAFGVESPNAISVRLFGCRLALVGRDNHPYDPEYVERAANLLQRDCFLEWGLQTLAPTHAGRVDSSGFRSFVGGLWGVDGNHADIDLLIWLLDNGGADVFFLQPG